VWPGWPGGSTRWPGWPGKTRSRPCDKPVDFCFFYFFLLKRRRFDFFKKKNWPGQPDQTRRNFHQIAFPCEKLASNGYDIKIKVVSLFSPKLS
jgi:hypothetical protein